MYTMDARHPTVLILYGVDSWARVFSHQPIRFNLYILFMSLRNFCDISNHFRDIDTVCISKIGLFDFLWLSVIRLKRCRIEEILDNRHDTLNKYSINWRNANLKSVCGRNVASDMGRSKGYIPTKNWWFLVSIRSDGNQVLSGILLNPFLLSFWRGQ